MTLEELLEIKARYDAAKPAPWRSFVEGRDHDSGSSFIMTPGNGEIYLSGATEADQDFIAAARQDIPRLVSALLALRAGSSTKESK